MRTIDVSPDDLVLPGDCLGRAVLYENYAWTIPQTALTDSPAGTHPGIKVMHPGSRDRLRRVLAAGKRCVACDGEGKSGPKMSAFKWADDGMVPCGTCNGTGYTRPPHNLGHFTDAEIAGRITPLVAAGLWWASVLRVDAGMGPVVGPATCDSEDASALVDRHRLSVAHYALFSPKCDRLLLPLPDRIARLRLASEVTR